MDIEAPKTDYVATLFVLVQRIVRLSEGVAISAELLRWRVFSYEAAFQSMRGVSFLRSGIFLF